MNEQELQQAYTRHCEVTGQTKMTRTGFEYFKAGFRLAQPAAGELPARKYRERSNHVVLRQGDWQPCYCWAEEDHRIGQEVAATPAAAHGDEAVLPDNLRTHRRSWLNAMERLIDLEPGGLDPTAEDLNGYWCHELQAMRDMYADLDRIDAMRAQAGEGGE